MLVLGHWFLLLLVLSWTGVSTSLGVSFFFFEQSSVTLRNNVVDWKTKGKINTDLQCCFALRVEFLLKPESGYLRDAEVT